MVLLSLCLFSCGPGTADLDDDAEYWQRQINWAKSELQREGLTPEEKGFALTKMARSYSGVGQPEKAVAIWSSILADENADPVSKTRSTYRLALWHEQNESWDQASILYHEYADLYRTLNREQTENFDHRNEDPASLLFHVGEIQEDALGDLAAAEESFLEAIVYARDTGSPSLLNLKELYGDFLFRHGRIEDALFQYSGASVPVAATGWPQSVVLLSPKVKFIECLCLLGRCEDARRELKPISEEWADSLDELNAGYVEKAEELLELYCNGV